MAGEWRETTLGEVIELKRGYDLPSRERREGLYPIVSSSGISGYHARAMAKAPGVVTGRYGTIGQVFFITQDFWPLNTSLYVRDFKGNDPRFVSYFLGTINFEAYSDKGAVPGVNRNHLHSAPVRIPPLREQQAIACILGSLDDKIELNRRRNRTLEAMAQAIFQSWFVDCDPVKTKAAGGTPAGLSPAVAALFPDRFEDSTLGPIPAGWRACRWGDISTLEYGKSLRNYAEANGPYQVFGTNGPIGWHAESLCGSAGIIIGRKGAYRGVHYSPKPFYVIDTAFFLKPKEPIDLKWAYYELLKFDINGMDSGSAIPSTSRVDFYSIPVLVPAQAVLQSFGLRTQPIYDRMEAAESENVTLAALRDALLPKLISGELRVPDAERIAGRAL